jgi:prepilin-type N-terminal cleavage/methylation domain-containing protein
MNMERLSIQSDRLPAGWRRSGFTLIELMVVIVIIGILLGIIIPVLGAMREKAKKVQVSALISDSKLACETFRLENGQYPWMKPPDVTKKLASGGSAADVAILGWQVYAELRATTDANINKTMDYLGEIKKTFLLTDAGNVHPRLKDVWGQEFIFRVNYNGLQAVIYSKGKNMTDETNTGTSPDAAKYPDTYYYFAGTGKTGDDLTSF